MSPSNRQPCLFVPIFAVLLNLASSRAHCQGVGDCSVSLLKSKYISVAQDNTKLAVLQEIDREQYASDSKTHSFLAGVLQAAKGDLSPDEYSERRNRELSKYSLRYSHDQLSYYILDAATPDGLVAYQGCLAALNPIGVRIFPAKFDSNRWIELNVKWTSEEHYWLPHRINLEVKHSSGDQIDADQIARVDGKWIYPNSPPLTLKLPRHPKHDIAVTATIDGRSGSFFIAAPVQLPLVPCSQPQIGPDPGRLGGRTSLDVDRDSCPDNCRIVGPDNRGVHSLLCDWGYRGAPDAPTVIPIDDPGIDLYREWFSLAGRPTLCVERGENSYFPITCYPMTRDRSFGAKLEYNPRDSDRGFNILFLDYNGDGILDVCKRISGGNVCAATTQEQVKSLPP